MFRHLPLDQRDPRGTKRGMIHGRGINDAPYQTSYKTAEGTETCPYFMRWRTMFQRCYSTHWLNKHPTYMGCEVCSEWYSFMNFRAWMTTQDWEGKQLDKDLLSLGNGKVYSPATCLFISPQINSLFNTGNTSKDGLPLGVGLNKGRYEVGCSDGTGRKFVGNYDTVPEAIDAYVTAKRKVIQTVIADEPNHIIREAVQKFSDFFTDNLLLQKTMY